MYVCVCLMSIYMQIYMYFNMYTLNINVCMYIHKKTL
jgi:hypothetical protein